MKKKQNEKDNLENNEKIEVPDTSDKMQELESALKRTQADFDNYIKEPRRKN